MQDDPCRSRAAASTRSVEASKCLARDAGKLRALRLFVPSRWPIWKAIALAKSG